MSQTQRSPQPGSNRNEPRREIKATKGPEQNPTAVMPSALRLTMYPLLDTGGPPLYETGSTPVFPGVGAELLRNSEIPQSSLHGAEGLTIWPHQL